MGLNHSHKKKTLVRKRTIPHCSELIVLVFTHVQTSECSKTNFDLAWNGWKETDFSYFLGYFGWCGKWFLFKRSEKGVTHPWKSTSKRKLTEVCNFAQKTTIKTLRNISKTALLWNPQTFYHFSLIQLLSIVCNKVVLLNHFWEKAIFNYKHSETRSTDTDEKCHLIVELLYVRKLLDLCNRNVTDVNKIS